MAKRNDRDDWKERDRTETLTHVQSPTKRIRLDRGCSWVICGTGFLIQCVVAAQTNISGIIFTALLDKYGASRSQTAWVTALASGVSDAFAMVPALLGYRLGFANVIMLGGFACAVGMFSSSFATNIYLLYLTYGLVWGSGACLCYCSALFLLPKYFRARLGLANGIVFLGAPVGTLVLSPVAQNLLSNTGLTGTFQVFAGLQLIVVFCGFAARLIPTPSELDRPLDLRTVKSNSFDWSIFKNKGYMVFAVSLCVFMPAYLVPYVHLVRLAEDSGIDSFNAAFLVSFIAFGSVTARPLFGKLMDRPGINRLTVFQITLLLVSVSTTLVPIATNYEWLATYAFLYGFLEGCFVISLPLIVQDLVGDSKLPLALGSLYCFRSLPMTAGPSIAGWIYDTSNSYDVAFFCAGGIAIVSTCLLFIVPPFKSRSLSKQTEVVQLLESSDKETVVARETCL